MERRPRSAYRAVCYPERPRGINRRRVLRGLGASATVLVAGGGASLLTGCLESGFLGQTRTWTIVIPEDGSRRLKFDMGQYVDYHVKITVSDQEVADFVEAERSRLGAEVDAVVRAHGFYDLEPPVELGSVEEEARASIASEFLDDFGHVDLERFDSVAITIDDWVDDWWAGGEGDDDTGDDDTADSSGDDEPS